MDVLRNTHQGNQLVRVLTVLAILTVLALLVFAKSLGATPISPLERAPALLVPEQTLQATPMPTETGSDRLTQPRGDQIWRILRMHRDGELNEAVIAWTLFRLPERVAVWQDVATAAALLELGNWEEAEPILNTALERYPQNAALHYYQALFHLEQAANAAEWNDAIGPTNVRLATHPAPALLVHPRSFYELLAIQELETVLRLASNIPWKETLVTEVTSSPSDSLPCVIDLLETLGAKTMVANAHNVLSELYLTHGDTASAENHLDMAVESGVYVFSGYRELGAVYEIQGRHQDAARAYAKAIQHGEGFALPTQHLLKNLWKGMLQAN